MKCSKAEQLMMRYMDQTLAPEEAEKLNEHLRVCEKCREEFFAYEMIVNELSDVPMIEAPLFFEEEVMEKISCIEPEYDFSKVQSKENILALIWGSFSFLFGIGMVLFIYQQPIIQYLENSPYVGEWVKTLIPRTEILSSYTVQMQEKLADIIVRGQELYVSAKTVLIPILIVLGTIQYIAYKKQKVEIE